MKELLFCNKCGNTSTSSSYKIGDRCYTCEIGTYIGTGIDWSTAYMELSKEYEKTHDGHCPSSLESDEMLREKYFYNKLDSIEICECQRLLFVISAQIAGDSVLYSCLFAQKRVLFFGALLAGSSILQYG